MIPYNTLTYNLEQTKPRLSLWKLFLIFYKNEWQQIASSEGRKMSPDISNYADCVQTSARIAKKREKLYMVGTSLETKALL